MECRGKNKIFITGCEGHIPVQYLLNLQNNYESFLDEIRKNGSEILAYDWSEFGFSSEVDTDIKNFENVKNGFDQKRYEEIQRNIQYIFNTDANMSGEAFSEEEIDDDELLEQEKSSHGVENNAPFRKS